MFRSDGGLGQKTSLLRVCASLFNRISSLPFVFALTTLAADSHQERIRAMGHGNRSAIFV
jgi:hypothetical protein